MSLRRIAVCHMIVSILVLSACSKDPEKLLESGKKYLAESKYSEATIQLRSAINVNPQLAEAHYLLATVYLETGQIADAKQELFKTVQLQPRNTAAQLKHGNMLLLDRKFDEARATAELVLRQEPSNIRAQILLGSSYVGILNMNDAIGELRNSFERESKALPTYLDLSAIPNFKGQPEMAE